MQSVGLRKENNCKRTIMIYCFLKIEMTMCINKEKQLFIFGAISLEA